MKGWVRILHWPVGTDTANIAFDVVLASCEQMLFERALGIGQGNFTAGVQATSFQNMFFKNNMLESFYLRRLAFVAGISLLLNVELCIGRAVGFVNTPMRIHIKNLLHGITKNSFGVSAVEGVQSLPM